jgi:L-iditol 2-dehydrogenase
MIDALQLVSNNISLFGIRGEGRSGTHRAVALMKQKRFDATLMLTHRFTFENLPIAVRYARDRVEDAIKVVIRVRETSK